jgi:hypothetical protein
MAARQIDDCVVQNRPGRRPLQVVRDTGLKPAGEPPGIDDREESDKASEVTVNESSNGFKLEKHMLTPFCLVVSNASAADWFRLRPDFVTERMAGITEN